MADPEIRRRAADDVTPRGCRDPRDPGRHRLPVVDQSPTSVRSTRR